jgi:hypothetical protein
MPKNTNINKEKEILRKGNTIDKEHEIDIIKVAKTTRSDPQGHGGF